MTDELAMAKKMAMGEVKVLFQLKEHTTKRYKLHSVVIYSYPFAQILKPGHIISFFSNFILVSFHDGRNLPAENYHWCMSNSVLV
jgi:hypothetical protein